MEELINKLTRLLKSHGYSLTKPRIEVFKYLIGKEPLSISAVTKSLETTVDRASIYRTVTLFQQLGIVQRHNIGWKYKIELTDMFSDHHHHFTCTLCGKIVAINETELESFIDSLAKQYGFTATQHQIELQGICASCKRV